jgi:hypothetical protein
MVYLDGTVRSLVRERDVVNQYVTKLGFNSSFVSKVSHKRFKEISVLSIRIL